MSSTAATLSFALPQAGHVRLSVHDVLGREVMHVADGEYSAGRHVVALDNAQTGRLGAGLYFVRMQVAGRVFNRRFAIAR